MTERRRFYLTTAIAYANNRPGLHTLYEVVGADVIARWHRMLGDDTRFLTGTDEYSVNIATTAAAARPDAEGLRGRDGGALPDRRGRPGHQPRPLHPHDRPRPRRGRPRDDPPRPRQRRHLPRRLRGLVLPQRGLPQHERPHRGRARRPLPQPPGRRAAVADGAQLVLPPQLLPGAPGAPLRGASRLGGARVPQERDARLHPPGPRGLLREPRGRHVGHPLPAPAGRLVRAARGRHLGPGGRHRLRLVRRAHQLHHGRRLPGRPGGLRALVAGRPAGHRQGHQPAAHHLLAGHAHERRAAAAAQGLGPRLAARPGRAHEQEPRQLPRPGRRRGRARSRRDPLHASCARSPSTATATSPGTASCAATTRTSPTTSATCSTARCR